MGAPRKRTGAKHHLDEHLRELAALADTAGAEVVGEMAEMHGTWGAPTGAGMAQS